MSRITEGLNEAQKRVVMTTAGPLLVVAGPGTGKTLTIVRRFAYLMEQGVKPEQILAVTFTNRAAREMSERVRAFSGETRTAGMFMGTFHLLGLRIMREQSQDDFTVCGRTEQVDLLKGLTGSRKKAERMAGKISRIKALGEEADEETREIWRGYEDALRSGGFFDFDDLIRVPLDLLREEGTARRYREMFKYVMVDEYQDINAVQYALLGRLVSDEANICAVGDSDQAIYAFRGADVGNFLNFERDFAGACRIVLKKNYRSSQVIVAASSQLIGHNGRRIEKELEAVREKGVQISIISLPDEKSEAETVVGEIEGRVGGTSHYSLLMADKARDFPEQGNGFHHFAVIFRTNAQAKVLEEAFFESGIPYQVVRGESRTWAGDMAETLRCRAAQGFSLPDPREIVRDLSDDMGLSDDDHALVHQLAGAFMDRSPPEALKCIADELKLLASGDAYDPRAEAVTLMTLHMAKGLEFKVVFITGAEDGLIPFTPGTDEADMEEERRLFYVGMTRAKDELIITHARDRFMYGRRLSGRPSPFLGEIPEDLVNRTSARDRPKRVKERQMKLF
jgi:DNA helicase II / ATP-dependent DNA helicase PcrA